MTPAFRYVHSATAFVAALIFATASFAQSSPATTNDTTPQSSSSAPTDQPAPQSSSTVAYSVPPSGASREQMTRTPTRELWRHPGIGLHIGINGAGLDIAEPLGQHFNVRVGGEYLRYTGDFTSDGAQINADLTVGGGKVALDYFPWHNGFHISPQARFAIQTAANVNVIVPGGQTITLDGQNYVSSATDPLRGQGYVDTRKTAVGVTVGYGNLSPRHGAHWSFPVEAGFYYIGQPNLTVTFTGTACDPSQPASIGCQKVDSDPGFQNDLRRFIQRQNNNLSYAKFFPIASFGVGYRF